MAAKPKKQEEESGEGAPLWIISFADMISLLMAFFVMLTTFSGMGAAGSEELNRAAKVALSANYYGGWYRTPRFSSMTHHMRAAGQAEKGSEKPTLEESQGTGMLAETQPPGFGNRKIFLIESQNVFWGSGTTLSKEGREFLDLFASFVNMMPERIAVSENGPGADAELGINRAIVVTNYLSSKGISKDRFSIGIRGMLPDGTSSAERMLEIALLDESAYK
jgi:outer membrane protein OmpA-like peptidoglycan-associated protein